MIKVYCEKQIKIKVIYSGDVKRDDNRGTCLCTLQFAPAIIVCEERGYKTTTCNDCPFLKAEEIK